MQVSNTVLHATRTCHNPLEAAPSPSPSPTLTNYLSPVAAQINELHTIREKVYGMEQAHIALKAK